MIKQMNYLILFLMVTSYSIFAGDNHPIGEYVPQAEHGQGRQNHQEHFNFWEIPAHIRYAFEQFVAIRLGIARANLMEAQAYRMYDNMEEQNDVHQANLRVLQAQAQAQENLNRRNNETLLEHLVRPSTIVAFTSTVLFPVIFSTLKTYWSESSTQQMIDQKVELNKITIEQARLELDAKKRALQAQDFMHKLALRKEAITLEKEEAKIQVVANLASLSQKEADGEELTEKEKKMYEICQSILPALTPRDQEQTVPVAA